MKISEVIRQLKQIKKQHGDLEVINRAKPSWPFGGPELTYRIMANGVERHCTRPKEGAWLVVRIGY